MVSIMDVESDRQVCDNRVIISQSAVSQKSIDLDISLRPIIATTSDRDTVNLELITTGTPANQLNQPCSSTATSIVVTNPYNSDSGDTDLVKKSMKLNLIDSSSINSNAREVSIPGDFINAASSGSSVGASSSTVVTTTAAIIMKHHKLRERTFSDEIGSPKSPAATTEVVDDRKALRDALYQGIFHRHRRTIFAVGSFLRMLKSRNSSYNTIRSSSEGEDDTK
ncbi:uncharacterized protein LOC126558898 isoform X2 [Anopheles maculipalpis]|uniref:uncharacterized protein LOC126558898 isoform X2 n=1 Tax=Anopheles maculipalpis TaxID=1496333 RepID=UPI00215985C5|nr:uncharacterized protein LOC126558898 isoform X2 [Anopheles maculipalpis]